MGISIPRKKFSQRSASFAWKTTQVCHLLLSSTMFSPISCVCCVFFGFCFCFGFLLCVCVCREKGAARRGAGKNSETQKKVTSHSHTHSDDLSPTPIQFSLPYLVCRFSIFVFSHATHFSPFSPRRATHNGSFLGRHFFGSLVIHHRCEEDESNEKKVERLTVQEYRDREEKTKKKMPTPGKP